MREQLVGLQQKFKQPLQAEYVVVDRRSDPIGWLRTHVGDRVLQRMFGYSEQEYVDLLNRKRESVVAKSDVRTRVKDSFWKIHSFSRDTERLSDERVVAGEVGMIVDNIRTMIEEYLWSKNSVYGMKVVKLGDQTKIVAYDRATQEGEMVADAFARESIELMIERFEKQKATQDKCYASNEGGLRDRDIAEGALMKDLMRHAEMVLEDKPVGALVSMSPGPDKSAYADSMGYKTDVRFSHLRLYRFEKISDHEVAINATTIFHYAPLWRQRLFAFRYGQNFVNNRIPLVGATHVDFLNAPYFIGDVDDHEIDQVLNGSSFFEQWCTPEVHQKIIEHRVRRLDRSDEEYKSQRMNYLLKKYIWSYLLLTIQQAPVEQRMQVLADLLDDEQKVFVEYILEKEQRILGVKYSEEEQRVRLKSIDSFLVKRGAGGLCPVLDKTERVENDQESDSTEKSKTCKLKCRCGAIYELKAGEVKAFCDNPECRWDGKEETRHLWPDKIKKDDVGDTVAEIKMDNVRTDENLKDESLLDTKDISMAEIKKIMLVDTSTGEVIHHIGFAVLRRKLSKMDIFTMRKIQTSNFLAA